MFKQVSDRAAQAWIPPLQKIDEIRNNLVTPHIITMGTSETVGDMGPTTHWFEKWQCKWDSYLVEGIKGIFF